MAPLDSDLTILLTLKDRGAFTRRWMSYANAVRLPFKVLIADGGADESIASLLAAGGSFPNIKYDYVRYPFDDGYPRYYAKVVDALSRITTPFVAMADNDDFFVVDTLRASVDFLQKHAEFASCGGQSAFLWVNSTDAGGDAPVYGERVDWKRMSDIPPIEGATARERIRKSVMSAGESAPYDVKRTSALRAQYELVRDLNFQDLFLTEHVLWFLNTIAGKSMRMKELFYARQQNSPESSAEAHVAQVGNWLSRMLVPTWSADFAKFIEATAAALANTDSIPIEEARRLMVLAYREEIAPALLRDILAEPSVTAMMPIVSQAVERLVRLPRTSLLRRLVQRVYRRTEWLSSDVIYGVDLVARRSSSAERERQPIVDFLAGRLQ